jgi:hypothetical protein
MRTRKGTKLAARQVRRIRYRVNERNESQRKVARDYNVSQPMVHYISTGKAWRHVV